MGGKTPQTTAENEKPDEAARGKRAQNEDAQPTTRGRTRPGRRFGPGNKAAVGKGRPRRDAFVDEFFEECVQGPDGPIERRWALLSRLYTSAMDTKRKDHGRLLEIAAAYYFGKPRERVEMSGPEGGPIKTEDGKPRKRATTGELRKELEGILAKREAHMAKRATTNGASNGANGAHPAADGDSEAS